MAKIMTMAGAPAGGVTSKTYAETVNDNIRALVSWGPGQLIGVIAGSLGVVGGGILAYTGWRARDWKLYTGGGVAAAGLLAIGVSWYLERQRTQAVLDNISPFPTAGAAKEDDR